MPQRCRLGHNGAQMRPRPALVSAATSLLLLAACSPSTAPPVPTSTAATTTTIESDAPDGTPPEDTAVIDGLEITRITDPSFSGGYLAAITATPEALIAVGSDELPEDAAVWTSVDGTAWTRVESDTFGGEAGADGLDGEQFMADVATTPFGIVAVGGFERRAERDLDAAIWWSADGSSWERSADDDLVSTGSGHARAVTAWNGKVVVAGEGPGPVGSGERRPAIWISADGRAWETVEALALRVDGVINGIVGRGSRLYAVGATGHVLRPAVWVSDDGIAWDVIGDGPGGNSLIGSIDHGDADDHQDLAMTTVTITPDGLLATGTLGEPSRAVVWRSVDGLEWTLVSSVTDYERPTIRATASAVAVTDGRLTMVGSGQLDTTRFPPLSLAQVWASDDGGATWSQARRSSTSLATEGPDAPWHVGWMTDVISSADGFVAVGFVPHLPLPGPFYRQAVWLGHWE